MLVLKYCTWHWKSRNKRMRHTWPWPRSYNGIKVTAAFFIYHGTPIPPYIKAVANCIVIHLFCKGFSLNYSQGQLWKFFIYYLKWKEGNSSAFLSLYFQELRQFKIVIMTIKGLNLMSVSKFLIILNISFCHYLLALGFSLV